MTINDENNTEPRAPFIIEMEPSNELTELVTSPPALLPGAAATEQQADPPAAPILNSTPTWPSSSY